MARILITDDTSFMRIQLKEMITKAGHEVVDEAENGQEAVEKYKELRPDLVTMDITMPVMSGIEAVKEIRKIDPEAKIIMCSALGQQKVILDAINAGAKDFILKPITIDRISDILRKYL